MEILEKSDARENKCSQEQLRSLPRWSMAAIARVSMKLQIVSNRPGPMAVAFQGFQFFGFAWLLVFFVCVCFYLFVCLLFFN